MAEHSTLTNNHKIENWTYATAGARTAAVGLLPADVGKVAYQSDDGSYWRLTDDSPVTWAAVGASGSLPTTLVKGGGVDINGGSGVTAETQCFRVKCGIGEPANTMWAVKAKVHGKAKGGTTITFTPRLRWGSVDTGVTGDVILTGPVLVSANNTANQHLDIEWMVMFTGTPSSGFAQAAMTIIEKITDAGGLAKINHVNTLGSDVAITNGGQPNAVDHYIKFTIEMSALTGTPSFGVERGSVEFVPYQNVES